VKDLHLDQQLCFAVYSASHAFTRFYRPLLAQLGVTYPQYLVLLTLWERDGMSVSAIGERLLLDSGTLTPVLKRLEALGLVTRARSTIDERQVLVRLTGQGQSMRTVAEGFPARILGASECSGDELDALRRALLDLRHNLDRAAA
jgi:DNA-binding MarR family transcriptional regulator